jgi:hypothetical protein
MATAYRIKDWARHFENNRTREVVNMAWVPVPNKHDGEGFRRIMREPDGIVIYGCWHLILQVASKCLRQRGTLLRDDGTPMTPETISLKTGWDGEQGVNNFRRAFEFLSSPEVAWIEAFTPQPATAPQEPATASQVARARGTEPNRTEQNRTEIPNTERGRRPAAVDLLEGGAEKIKAAMHDLKQNPVEIALAVIGETTSDRQRGHLAKERRRVGEVAFRTCIEAFAAELAAGEEPRSRGAALNARLAKLEAGR